MSISSHFVGLPGGLLMSAIAFSIVVIVITGLMLMMFGLKGLAAVIHGSSRGSAEAPAESKPVAVQSTAPAPAAPVAAVAAEDDGELVAVITAAIMAACGTTARVISFKEAPRAPRSTAWRTSGRLQNCEGFAD